MKNRILLVVVIVVIIISLIVLPKLFKKTNSVSGLESIPSVEKVSAFNFESKLKEAEAFIERGSLLEAKEIYQKLMEGSLTSGQMSIVQAKLENLNVKTLLSGINIEHSQIYEVKPGDVLINIAKQFKTTVDSIALSNNIKKNIINPGMKLRVLDGKFSIFVDKSQNILILKFNDEVVKTYVVSTGKNNSTPTGTYKIINKIVDPPWYKDGKEIPPTSPENILGSRWMGIDLPGYGLHGTKSPEDIGRQVTEGCVRLRNEDVEEIYTLVPVETEVVIVD